MFRRFQMHRYEEADDTSISIKPKIFIISPKLQKIILRTKLSRGAKGRKDRSNKLFSNMKWPRMSHIYESFNGFLGLGSDLKRQLNHRQLQYRHFPTIFHQI